MTSFLSSQAQASSAAQASAALASRIDQALSDSTLALHSQLEDLVDRAIGDLHFEHRLELELVEAERVDLARELAEAKQAAASLQTELTAAHNLFEAEQRAHGQALVQRAALETRLEKSVRELDELGARLAAAEHEAEQLRQAQELQAQEAASRQQVAEEEARQLRDALSAAQAEGETLARAQAEAEQAAQRSLAELEAAEHDAEQLRQAHELLAQEAASRQQVAEEQTRHLRDALSAAQAEGEALTRALTEAEQAAQRALAELDAERNLLEVEKRAHAQSLVDNAALETRLGKGVREFEELGERLAAAEHDAKQLRQAHESQVQDGAERSAQQQAVEAALAASQQEACELRELLDETRNALVGQESRAAQAESAAEQARQQLDRQQVYAAEALQGLQQELRDALAEADASRGDLGQRLAQAGAEIEVLRQHSAALTEQAAAKDGRLAELGRALAQASERERKSSALIGDAKGVLAESKHNIALLEVKLRDSREEANMLRAELACVRLVQAEPLQCPL